MVEVQAETPVPQAVQVFTLDPDEDYVKKPKVKHAEGQADGEAAFAHAEHTPFNG